MSKLFSKSLNGVKVPHSKNTAEMETVKMPVPDKVVIPMKQHMGRECTPTVKLTDLVKVGQIIGDTDAFIGAPIHSSVSGKVTKIDEIIGTDGNPIKAVEITTDKLQEIDESVKVPEVTDLQSFAAAIRASGLVGLGGAGFPTHVKLMPKNLDEVTTLLVNGAECEPYITADNRAMLEDTACTASVWLAGLGLEVPRAARECRQLSGQLVLPAQPRMAASRTGRPSDKYGRDLTRLAQEGRLDPVLCRDAELDRMIEILCRRQKNNPCLLGEPGVGKSALAEALAQRIASGQITPALRGKRLLALDMASMVAGTKYRGDFEERFKNLLEELYRDRSTVLFIDEIHRLNRSVEEVLYSAMEDYAFDIVLGKGPAAKTMRINLNKFTLIGAMRSGAQMVSYELSIGLSMLTVVVFAGTMQTSQLIELQSRGWFLFTGHIPMLIAFVIYLIAGTAETNRGPFDLPEAESELTAGYHTEYSGIHFGFYYLAEYLNMFIVAGIASLLFLGGWMPLHIGGWEAFNNVMDYIPSFIWFFGKTAVVMFIIMWFKWTFPRLRIDQLLSLEWKYLVPIGFVNLLVMVLVTIFGIHF